MTDTTFGGRIIEARMARRLTTEQLAHRLGIEPAIVANWERDREEPTARQATQLAGILNVGMLWLLTGDAPPLADPSDTPDFSDTSVLTNKVDRLMTVQAQAAKLTSEILIEVARLQREIDRADVEPEDETFYSAA